jgi:UDP-glucose 4-epimerase
MAKCCVSGGAGFIGSHLVDRLIELGHKVSVLDNLSSGKKENINPKAEFVCHDISDLWWGGKFDYVFHLAAIPGVPYSMEHPTKTHRVNITGTYNVLKAAKDSGVKKVIFASTAALYGDCSHAMKEDDQIDPKSPYAFQKAVGEGYLRLFSEVYGLPTVSLRFFNVYGKRSDPKSPYALVIPIFKKLKKEGKPLTIYGNGKQTRDFIYVSDVVDALIKGMESPVENETINICSGEAISVNRLADLIGGNKAYLPGRKGDVENTVGCPDKALKLLNWRPKVPIEQGIELMDSK